MVSIPSQAGILLAGELRLGVSGIRRRSQYPLRRASSWRSLQPAVDWRQRSLNTLSGGHPLGGRGSDRGVDTDSDVSIPSQAGILLAVSDAGTCEIPTTVSIPSQAGILLAVD